MDPDVPESDAAENGMEEEAAAPPAQTETVDTTGRKRKRDKNDKKADSAVRYHCNYCNKDISTIIRVKCAVCQDFDLCLECFSCGIEMGNGHRKNHEYFIVDTLSYPFFEEDWGADEELLLLEGLEMYGPCNWADVAEHVGKHTAAQCKDHYYRFFFNSATPPWPDFSKVLTSHETLKQMREFWMRDEARRASRVQDTVEQEDDPKYSGSQKAPQSLVGGHSIADLAGWLPGRGDFETESDNAAETYLMDLAFLEEDPVVERDQKLKLIEIYNSKLDERAKKKQFIKERGLLDYKKLDKKRKDDKDIYDRYKTFAKSFSSADEHEKWLDHHSAERRLRKRIEQLRVWRQNGIHTLAEGEVFEQDKKKRESGTSRKRDASYGIDRSRANKTLPTRGAKAEAELEAWQERNKSKPRKPGAPLDLAGSPGVDLLSDNERDLCSQLRLLPNQYSLVKDTLIRESTHKGAVSKQAARSMLKIDVNKTSRIFDFLETSGWINRSYDTTNGEPPIVSPPLSPAGNRFGPPGTPQQQHFQQHQQQQQQQQQQMLALKTSLPGPLAPGQALPPGVKPATQLVIPPTHALHPQQHLQHPAQLQPHASQLAPGQTLAGAQHPVPLPHGLLPAQAHGVVPPPHYTPIPQSVQPR